MRNGWVKVGIAILLVMVLWFTDTTNMSIQAMKSEKISSLSSYTDVPEEHWARSAIMGVATRGIFNGVGNDRFAPDQVITRGEFESVVARMLAKDLAVISGVSKRAISREEAVVLVARCFVELGLVSAGDYENPYMYLYRFKDYWKVSMWARPSMGMAVKLGVVSGDAKGMLRPQGTMTRADAAVLVWRMLVKAEGKYRMVSYSRQVYD
jgi:hypothetical protein